MQLLRPDSYFCVELPACIRQSVTGVKDRQPRKSREFSAVNVVASLYYSWNTSSGRRDKFSSGHITKSVVNATDRRQCFDSIVCWQFASSSPNSTFVGFVVLYSKLYEKFTADRKSTTITWAHIRLKAYTTENKSTHPNTSACCTTRCPINPQRIGESGVCALLCAESVAPALLYSCVRSIIVLIRTHTHTHTE